MDNLNAKYMILDSILTFNFRCLFPREQQCNKSGSIFSTFGMLVAL